jgi:hypothetical protein
MRVPIEEVSPVRVPLLPGSCVAAAHGFVGVGVGNPVAVLETVAACDGHGHPAGHDAKYVTFNTKLPVLPVDATSYADTTIMSGRAVPSNTYSLNKSL